MKKLWICPIGFHSASNYFFIHNFFAFLVIAHQDNGYSDGHTTLKIKFKRQPFFCILYIQTTYMEAFDIRVRTVAGSKYFHVSPKVIGKSTRYEIWEDNQHLFSLESSNDAASGSLKLTDEFSDKEIYAGFIHALSDAIYPGKRIGELPGVK